MSDSYTKGLKVDGRIGDLISGSYSDGFNDGYKQGRADVEKEHLETFEWCHDCKEYDTVQHCCHRWVKQIRDTIEEAKSQAREDTIIEFLEKNRYCPGADWNCLHENDNTSCVECIAEQMKGAKNDTL